jgi:hypothetical protein
VDISKQNKAKSRKVLHDAGFVLVAGDVSVEGVCSRQDWWVNPTHVNQMLVERLMCDTTQTVSARAYINGDEEIEDVHEPLVDTDVMPVPALMVIDDAYGEPEEVRELALNSRITERNWCDQSVDAYPTDEILELIQKHMGCTVTDWDNPHNGKFRNAQWKHPNNKPCTVEHDWQAVLYLTPNPPVQTGTLCCEVIDKYSESDDADLSRYNTVQTIANRYNRLVIVPGKQVIRAENYFGNSSETGRLCQVFQFNTE